MKKLLLMTIVFLCLMYPITAYTAGETYTVTNISKCYNSIQVKVRSSIGIEDGEYSIVDCGKTNVSNLWSCSCKDDGNNIQILTDKKVTNVYDVTVEYYIASLTGDNIIDDDNKRTEQFTNIGFKSIKVIEPFKIPEFEDGGTILIVIGSIILFIGLVVFLLWKFLSKDTLDLSDRQIDKEIDDYINKYSK